MWRKQYNIKICSPGNKGVILFSKNSGFFGLNCGGNPQWFLACCCWSVRAEQQASNSIEDDLHS